MRDRVNKEIEGVQYGLFPINPFAASKIFMRLSRYGAKPIVQMVVMLGEKDEKGKSIMDKEISEMEDKIPQFAEALELCLEKMPDDELEKLAKELLPRDRFFADDKKINDLGLHLNNYGVMHLLKLIKFGLEVNFKDFLGGALGSLAR